MVLNSGGLFQRSDYFNMIDNSVQLYLKAVSTIIGWGSEGYLQYAFDENTATTYGAYTKSTLTCSVTLDFGEIISMDTLWIIWSFEIYGDLSANTLTGSISTSPNGTDWTDLDSSTLPGTVATAITREYTGSNKSFRYLRVQNTSADGTQDKRCGFVDIALNKLVN